VQERLEICAVVEAAINRAASAAATAAAATAAAAAAAAAAPTAAADAVAATARHTTTAYALGSALERTGGRAPAARDQLPTAAGLTPVAQRRAHCIEDAARRGPPLRLRDALLHGALLHGPGEAGQTAARNVVGAHGGAAGATAGVRPGIVSVRLDVHQLPLEVGDVAVQATRDWRDAQRSRGGSVPHILLCVGALVIKALASVRSPRERTTKIGPPSWVRQCNPMGRG